MEKGVKRFFGDPAPIQKNYLVDDFKTDFDPLPVTKSVHIQVGVRPQDALKETRWLQACADASGYPQAIVAFCDLTGAGLEATLADHQASGNLRGVRQIVGRDANEDAKLGTNALLDNPAFKRGLQTLAARNLSFDLQLTPPLLEHAAKLFKSVEEVGVALCHAGSLQDFSPEGVKAWETGLSRFAEHPNAICKISGWGMFDHGWTPESIRGYVLRVIDIFGPERVAFGSNFPVDKLSASYSKTMGAYLNITADFSTGERRVMFHDVAARFYRL